MTDVRLIIELTDLLAAIRKWYPDTEDPPRTIETQTRTTYGSRLPVASDVLSLRRRTRDTLAHWAGRVAAGRQLRPTTPCRRPRQRIVYGPTPPAGWPWVCGCGTDTGAPLLDGRRHPLDRDVPALLAFLGAHVEWLADHDGQKAADDLHHISTGLEQIVRQTRPSRVIVGPCPEPDCRGTMTATVRKGDDLLPSAIRCSVAPRDHVWEPHDWPALGRRTPFKPAGVARLLAAVGDVPAPREYGASGVQPSPEVRVGVPGRRWRRHARD